MKDVIKWSQNRQRGEWKEILEHNYGEAPAQRVEGDSIVVTFINHSTFLIQTQGLNILTDPVWSERVSPMTFAGPKRMRPPGIRFEDLPRIDMILLTHNHYDHLDIKTIKRLAEEFNPVIYTPLVVGLFLERKGVENVTEMDWWDELPVMEGMKLICTPAQHFSGRGMFDRDRTLWSGFALTTEKGSIYYSGDTEFGSFSMRLPNGSLLSGFPSCPLEPTNRSGSWHRSTPPPPMPLWFIKYCNRRRASGCISALFRWRMTGWRIR